jgi:hypothetical protein
MTSGALATTLGAVTARRSLAAAVLVLAAPALSACGGNLHQQTTQVYNPAQGVDDRSGKVDVLNALVVSGQNGSGTVIATLVNNDQTRSDTLKNVTGAGKDASMKVTPGGDTTIPAAGLLNLADSGRIFVEGPRVRAGYFVSITFSFDRSEAITVEVPVVNAAEPEYANVPLPSGSPTATGSPGESPGGSATASAGESPSPS